MWSKIMDPLTLVAIAVIVAAGAGFGAGAGLTNRQTKLLRAQAESIEALQTGQNDLVQAIQTSQQKILEQATKPIVIDAELRATLAEIPVQCLTTYGGDPLSVQCTWATCIRFGQSSAQRPECREVEKLMLETIRASQLKNSD